MTALVTFLRQGALDAKTHTQEGAWDVKPSTSNGPRQTQERAQNGLEWQGKGRGVTDDGLGDFLEARELPAAVCHHERALQAMHHTFNGGVTSNRHVQG